MSHDIPPILLPAEISTATLAAQIGVTPGTIRTRLCRTGSYFGVRPRKLCYGCLRWPADAPARLNVDDAV